MESDLKKHEHTVFTVPANYEKYFDPIYYPDKKGNQVFVGATKKTDIINKELRLCGYFAIITSDNMSAKEAIFLYKSRDSSEKLFRCDKSFLGNDCLRVYSQHAAESKIFISFISLIIRNRIFTCLKEEMLKTNTSLNYFTVPAAIRELEKITLIKQPNNKYLLDHAITKTQKKILNAFSIKGSSIKNHLDSTIKELESLQ